jgi:hypothetical protein
MTYVIFFFFFFYFFDRNKSHVRRGDKQRNLDYLYMSLCINIVLTFYLIFYSIFSSFRTDSGLTMR